MGLFRFLASQYIKSQIASNENMTDEQKRQAKAKVDQFNQAVNSSRSASHTPVADATRAMAAREGIDLNR